MTTPAPTAKPLRLVAELQALDARRSQHSSSNLVRLALEGGGAVELTGLNAAQLAALAPMFGQLVALQIEPAAP